MPARRRHNQLEGSHDFCQYDAPAYNECFRDQHYELRIYPVSSARSQAAMEQQRELPDGPKDAISSVRFSPNGTKLLATSWDRTITIYQQNQDAPQPFELQKRTQCRAPILDACWGEDESTIFTVGLDHDVRKVELDQPGEPQTVLSTHSTASNKVAYSRIHHIVISTSWDGTMHVHNLEKARSFIKVSLKNKPFALALTEQRVVVAMAERAISIYDIKALQLLTEQTDSVRSAPEDEGQQAIHIEPWQERESSLRFMIRAVATMSDGAGFMTSSIEGRVGVDWFDPAMQKEKSYAFKCHRERSNAVDEDGTKQEVDIVYPVNAVLFHPRFGSFITAGGDGDVVVWDAVHKRRIRILAKVPASIAAVDFSPDGKMLAIGMSPGFEDGQEDAEVDQNLVKVFVQEVRDSDVKGKSSAK